MNTGENTMNDIYVKGTWTFTSGACFALRKVGINLTELNTNKGFCIPATALEAAGVRYVRGNPETKGLLTLNHRQQIRRTK